MHKTDEERANYIVEAQEALEMLGVGYDNAAEIHPPRKINVIREGGLEEYKVWGWVKVSANFIHHIKKLKGAKLAIWQVVSLSIDENGECKLSIHEIADLAGYSYAETHESLKELDEMNYLSINREKGKKSMYSPNFAARGFQQPTDDPSRKSRGVEEQPLQSTRDDPSSPALENALPTIKELKEYGADAPMQPLSIEWQMATGVEKIVMPNEEQEKQAKRLDFANWVAMYTSNQNEARLIAMAFQNTRQIELPESKVKGQRKAIKEMLEMGVKAVHVEEATKQLMEKGMTVTDLFSVSKTAIDLATKPAELAKKTESRNLND